MSNAREPVQGLQADFMIIDELVATPPTTPAHFEQCESRWLARADFKTRAAAFWAELKQLETKYGVRVDYDLDDREMVILDPKTDVRVPFGSDYVAFLKSKGVEP